MARILALLCTHRTQGYTASLWRAAAQAAADVKGVAVEAVGVADYSFGPCRSCYSCIRGKRHVCPLPDDMGRSGRGKLFARVARANALLVVEPVHFWGNAAATHTFIERLYPFGWSGRLVGMPFGSISCAANQGMHHLAAENLCKWSFTMGLRYAGGVAAHAADMTRAERGAKQLGRKLARAALRDARGRRGWSELARYRAYRGKPWDPYRHYYDNLRSGSSTYKGSLIERARKSGEFTDAEAAALLEEAGGELRECIRLDGAGEEGEALRHLVKAGALWTHATWKQLLERDVIGAAQPAAYRPLGKGKQASARTKR
jgi:multimeric flavodoxin WrbA